MNSSSTAPDYMVLHHNSMARPIAISRSVAHRHEGSNEMRSHPPVYELGYFPIGMVFVFAIVTFITLIAVTSGILKLRRIWKDKKRATQTSKKSMTISTLSLRDQSSPSSDLLNQASMEYLSMAAMPLMSLYAMSKRLRSRNDQSCAGASMSANGVRSCDQPVGGVTPKMTNNMHFYESETAMCLGEDFEELDHSSALVDRIRTSQSNHTVISQIIS